MRKVIAGLIALSCLDGMKAAFTVSAESISSNTSASSTMENSFIITLDSEEETIVTPSDMPEIIDETETITDEMKKMIWDKFKTRACSHKNGIKNHSKENHRNINTVKFIITCKYLSESFQSEKVPLYLISLFVKFFIIFPRFFTVLFGRNNGNKPVFFSKRTGSVIFICCGNS